MLSPKPPGLGQQTNPRRVSTLAPTASSKVSNSTTSLQAKYRDNASTVNEHMLHNGRVMHMKLKAALPTYGRSHVYPQKAQHICDERTRRRNVTENRTPPSVSIHHHESKTNKKPIAFSHPRAPTPNWQAHYQANTIPTQPQPHLPPSYHQTHISKLVYQLPQPMCALPPGFITHLPPRHHPGAWTPQMRYIPQAYSPHKHPGPVNQYSRASWDRNLAAAATTDSTDAEPGKSSDSFETDRKNLSQWILEIPDRKTLHSFFKHVCEKLEFDLNAHSHIPERSNGELQVKQHKSDERGAVSVSDCYEFNRTQTCPRGDKCRWFHRKKSTTKKITSAPKKISACGPALSIGIDLVHSVLIGGFEGEIGLFKEGKHPLRVLLLGEGDFSFGLALIRRLKRQAANNKLDNLQMITTSPDTFEDLVRRYECEKNITALQSLKEVTVLSEIDARNLDQNTCLSTMLFDRIVFNFPHTGLDDCKLNGELVFDFLKSCHRHLSQNGSIWMTLCNIQPKTWRVENHANCFRLRLVSCLPFRPQDYPGYCCKQVSRNLAFPLEGAKTLVYMKSPESE